MITVTTDELKQAEREAERAQEELREAERDYASNRASQTAYARHKDAVEVADQAAVRARLLRRDWEEQEAVRQLRAAEGEAAAREMAGAVEGLAGSRMAAVGAVVDAVVAMGRALDLLAEHDRLVRAALGRLGGRGLRHGEGEPTGAGLDGSAWIDGTCWPLVDAGSVVGRCLTELVADRYPRHPLARMVWAPHGGVTAGKGRDEVLAMVRAERGR
ncbi:hypothetical protein ABZ612_16440 [Streptomyces avermitilis]|uniref:hypothetical protein n=1 Tax=Streptomyces avermitilis TaxID=33903 RepID=UPI0033D81D52